MANVLPKFQTVNILVRPLSKKRRFRTRFDIQHVRSSKILAKSPCERFYLVFSSFSGKLIWKMSPLVSDEILEIFVYKLTTDGKYPVQAFENLQLQKEMQLSEKGKIFPRFFFFFEFLESTSNFEHFETDFGSQHVKASQMLEKSS